MNAVAFVVLLTLLSFNGTIGTKVFIDPTQGADDSSNLVFKNLPTALQSLVDQQNYQANQKLEILFATEDHYIISSMLPSSLDVDGTEPSVPSFFDALNNGISAPEIELRPWECTQDSPPKALSGTCLASSSTDYPVVYVKTPIFHFRFFQHLMIKNITFDGIDMMIWKNCQTTAGTQNCCEGSINSENVCCSIDSKFGKMQGCRACQHYDDGHCPHKWDSTSNLGVPEGHYIAAFPLFVFDSSLNNPADDVTPTMTLTGATIKNFLHQPSSIINFRTPGTLTLSGSKFMNISTIAGVVTTNFDTILDVSKLERASMYSLDHWKDEAMVTGTLGAVDAAKVTATTYDVQLNSKTSFKEINTKSMPRRNKGVESNFFSYNSGVIRFVDYSGKLDIDDSSFTNVYCDLIVDQEDITGLTGDHIGGSAIRVVGSNVTMKVKDSTIDHTMSSHGAVYFWNLAGTSECTLMGTQISYNHGLLYSAIYLRTEVPLQAKIDDCDIDHNIISSNRAISELGTLQSATIGIVGPRETAVGWPIQVIDSTMSFNYGAGMASAFNIAGPSVWLKDTKMLDSGNMIYGKYAHSLYTTLHPSGLRPKSSGVAKKFILLSGAYDFKISDCTFARNWLYRAADSRILVELASIYNAFNFEDNTIQELRGQIALGETEEWGYTTGQDSADNLNWVTTDGADKSEKSQLFSAARVFQAPTCTVTLSGNTFKEIFLTGTGQYNSDISAGDVGIPPIAQLKVNGNSFIDVGAINTGGAKAHLLWLAGFNYLEFNDNTFDNSKWLAAKRANDLSHYPTYGSFTHHLELKWKGNADAVNNLFVERNTFRGIEVAGFMFSFVELLPTLQFRNNSFSDCSVADAAFLSIGSPADIYLVENVSLENCHGQLVTFSGSGSTLKLILMNSVFIKHDLAANELIQSSVPHVLLYNNVFVDNYNSQGPLISQQGGWMRSYGNAFMYHKSLVDGGIYSISGGTFTDTNSLYFGNGSGNRGGVLNVPANTNLVLKDNIYRNNYAIQAGGVMFLSASSKAESSNNVFLNNGVFDNKYLLPDDVVWSVQGTFEHFLTLLEEFVKFSGYTDPFFNLIKGMEASFKPRFDALKGKTAKQFHSEVYTGSEVFQLPPNSGSNQNPFEHPTSTGGVISVGTQSLIESDDDVFLFNRAQSASVFQCSSSKKVTSVFKNSEARENTAQIVGADSVDDATNGDATFKLLDCKMEVSDLEMKKNVGPFLTSGILLISSELTATDSVFEEQGGPKVSAFISAVSRSSIDLTNCQFIKGTGTTGGAIVLSEAVEAKLSKCRFRDNEARKAAAIYSFISDEIKIEETIFEQNSAQLQNSDVEINGSTSVTISKNSKFRGSGVRGKIGIIETTTVLIDQVVIDGLQASAASRRLAEDTDGQESEYDKFFRENSMEENSNASSALKLEECTNITITNSEIKNNRASTGAALIIDGSELDDASRDEAKLTLSGSTFSNNWAFNEGGAVQLEDFPECYIYDTTFADNVAFNKSGGGIYSSCPTGGCTIKFAPENGNAAGPVKFESNKARVSGAGFAWVDAEPVFASSDVEFTTNLAQYGGDISGVPYAIVRISDKNVKKVSLPNDDPENANMTEESYQPPSLFDKPFQSGGKVQDPLYFAIVDRYGQVIKSDNATIAELQLVDGDSGEVLEGRKTAEDGIFNFEGMFLTLKPTTTGTYKITTEAFTTTYPSFYNKFQVYFRECLRGEVLTSDQKCYWCGTEISATSEEAIRRRKYSISPSDKECKSCPSDAYCWGGDAMGPRKGFWRLHSNTDDILECPNPDACLGIDPGVNEQLPSGRCDEDNGYVGTLCKECKHGYIPGVRSTCSECPHVALNALKLVGLMLLAVILVLFMVRSSLRNAATAGGEKKKSFLNVYLRIFTNYIQLVTLTSSIDLNWPQEFINLFTVQENLGSVSQQIFSFDCFLQTEDGMSIVYSRLIILNLLPVLLLLVSAAVWACIWLYKKKACEYKTPLISTMVVLYFLIHPSIMRQNFVVFSCRSLGDGNTYLDPDLSQKCWEDQHLKWALLLALPGFLIWVVGVPLATVYVLYRRSTELETSEVKARFGFLYHGFKPQFYYWEILIVMRKLAISCTAVFLTVLERPIQALVSLAFLMFSYHIQEKWRPYAIRPLNLLEARSIVISLVTIYCGMYFVTDELSNSSKVMLFVLLLLANLFFAGSLIYYISRKSPGMKHRDISDEKDTGRLFKEFQGVAPQSAFRSKKDSPLSLARKLSAKTTSKKEIHPISSSHDEESVRVVNQTSLSGRTADNAVGLHGNDSADSSRLGLMQHPQPCFSDFYLALSAGP